MCLIPSARVSLGFVALWVCLNSCVLASGTGACRQAVKLLHAQAVLPALTHGQVRGSVGRTELKK